MAQTINGMIARSDGKTPWSDAEWKSFYQTVQEYPALIRGSKTYRIMLKSKEIEQIGKKQILVLSRKKKIPPLLENVIVVHSPHEAMRILQQKKYARALLIGGAKANISFLKERLINEIILDIEPFVFGNGIPLFAKDLVEAKLLLTNKQKMGTDTVQLRYTVGEIR